MREDEMAGPVKDRPDGAARGVPASIRSVTPTICALMGIDPPRICDARALDAVVSAASEIVGATPMERCLIYAPDALGEHLLRVDPSFFDPVARHAPIRIRSRSVFPPKTPVCFASMFTGADPAAHGIQRYERPVLGVDTLFDALLRAGKRVAIVAVADSSVDLIFRERRIDYFSEAYDPDVMARAASLIEEDRHDLIVVYHQEYDDRLHETGPFAPRAFLAARGHVDSFAQLSAMIDRGWSGHSRMILMAPDHGAHVDPATGRGDHGIDTDEDMSIGHYYGIRAADGSRVR